MVLLHGFGEDDTIWDDLITGLHSVKLIIPVIPGSGNTPSLPNAKLEDHAKWLKEIIDHENADSVILVGHSMGGYISLAFAELYPARLKALGLFHSSAFADDEEKIATRRKGMEFIRKHGSFAFLETSTPNLFYDEDKNRNEIQQLLEKGKQFDPKALIQYYEAMIARPDRTEVLKKATFPVLFILGRHDKAVPFDSGLQQTHLPENAYIHILRNSGHMGMFEEPAESLEILVKFIEEVRR